MNDQLLLKEDCEIGMEVYLVKPDTFYVLNEKNPRKGGIYECTGIIVALNDCIKVKWKNGISNWYKDRELSLAESTEYRSIWPN